MYKELIKTAYRENDRFYDEIDSVEKLQLWLCEHGFSSIKATDEMVFRLANVRHMIKKYINASASGRDVNTEAFNKFADKYRIDGFLQIGRTEALFFKDPIEFEEPYQTIFQSFKDFQNRKYEKGL